MVLTSHDKLGDTGNKTGFWLEEFRGPLLTSLKTVARGHVGLAQRRPTPARLPPAMPKMRQTEATKTLQGDDAGGGGAKRKLANTKVAVRQYRAERFRCDLLPRRPRPGCGIWPKTTSINLIETFSASDRPSGRLPMRPRCSNTPKVPTTALVSGPKKKPSNRFHQHRRRGRGPDGTFVLSLV